MESNKRERPFLLQGALRPTGIGALDRSLEQVLERLSGLQELDRRYCSLPNGDDAPAFLERVFDQMNISIEADETALAGLPADGPLVVVANHPFGAVEGMALAHILGRVRPDVRFLANFVLARIPELRELFFSVDPFGGGSAAQRNRAPMRHALQWLRDGHALGMFPAGEVAHLHPSRGQVTDPAWSPAAARMARRTGAAVVPVWFEGRNSLLFQLLGLLHPRLRTALLPRELLNKQDSVLRMRIGAPIPAKRIAAFDDDAAATAYLRLRTYMLADEPSRAAGAAPISSADEALEPVAEALPPARVAGEVAGLPAEQCLERNGALEVWYARAAQIPLLLQEIGRLREVTFRATGEGTGKSSDLDLYDQYYLHLFVWNSERDELVGAYRLGLADQILQRFGKKGLYTQSLFKYRRRLLEQLNPAIELGRSFVRPEYQRSYSPLLLLWKGIGQYVARFPRYRVLFGPVSISNDYESQSQQLLVDFLKHNNYVPNLARLVRPRKPFRGNRRPAWHGGELAVIKDIDGVSDLVAQLERDNKGVPILLKQYLKMGGQLLGFNVDPQFSDALDGLIMVDLKQTDPRVLQRYMGKEGAARFTAYHAAAEDDAISHVS